MMMGSWRTSKKQRCMLLENSVVISMEILQEVTGFCSRDGSSFQEKSFRLIHVKL